MPPSLPSLLVLAWDDADTTARLHRDESAASVLPLVQALAGRQPVLALLPQLPEALRTEAELAAAALTMATRLEQAARQAEAARLEAEGAIQEFVLHDNEPVLEEKHADAAALAGVWVLDLADGGRSRIVGLSDLHFEPAAGTAQNAEALDAYFSDVQNINQASLAALPTTLVVTAPLDWVGEHRMAGTATDPAAPYAGRDLVPTSGAEEHSSAGSEKPAAPYSSIIEQGHLLENTGQEFDWLKLDEDSAPFQSPDPAEEALGEDLPETEADPTPAPFKESSENQVDNSSAQILDMSDNGVAAESGEPESGEAADLQAPDLRTPAYSEEEEEWTPAPSTTFVDAQAALRSPTSESAPVETGDSGDSGDLQYRIIQYARFAMHLATGPEEKFGVIYAASWPTWLAALEIRYRTRRPLVLHLSQLLIDTAAPANRGWELELERYALRRARLILVTSDTLRRRVLAHYPTLPGSVRVVALEDEVGIERELQEIALS